jgi:hypothetical protein
MAERRCWRLERVLALMAEADAAAAEVRVQGGAATGVQGGS